MADIARIKGNIAKMIAQDAPEADIDAYVASEGVTLDQLRAPSQPKQDKYQEAAKAEIADLKSKGIDTGTGYTRRLAHGVTFGADNTILAGLTTPLEMIKRGVGPVEAYNYTKAREDEIMNQARENTGALGTAVEIGGGIGSGLKLAQGGMTFARNLAPNAGILPRSLASMGDSAAMGAFAGFNEGNGLGDRLEKGATGGLLGGAVGAAAPATFALGGAVLNPIASNIMARANPTRFAQGQVARGLSESGLTPQQVAGDVATAAREGQGMFTLADAMGNSGQRMLASTARAPGQARTDVVNFLEQRQAGQGRRVANSLAEGFDSPMTAQRLDRTLTGARDTWADQAYSAHRADAGPVDLSGVIGRIDQTLSPGLTRIMQPASNIADDSVEGVLRRIRGKLTDDRSVLSDFEAIQRVRGDLADSIEKANRAGEGNKVRLLTQVRNELDRSMENASEGFRATNAEFRARSGAIDAIQDGRQAAQRGRSEDVIADFRARPREQQLTFRAGYADPLIEGAQVAPFGANKARPLTSDAFADEAAAMAPGNALMQRRIGRENTMFQTRAAATGNSKTVENLADDAALGVDPTISIVGQLMAGNYSGALRSTLAAGSNALTGNTPAVRQAVADILMSRGQNVNPRQLQSMLDQTMLRLQQIQNMARSIGRGASGGLAVGPSATGNRR